MSDEEDARTSRRVAWGHVRGHALHQRAAPARPIEAEAAAQGLTDAQARAIQIGQDPHGARGREAKWLELLRERVLLRSRKSHAAEQKAGHSTAGHRHAANKL